MDMDALRKRIRDVENAQLNEEALSDTSSEDIDLEAGKYIEQFESVEALWVIVFTSKEDKEGVYSLSVGDENIVLAFQEQAEANRYAKLLEVQDFPAAKVYKLAARELRDFCTNEGFRLGFVPSGSLITPPEESAIEDSDYWRIKKGGADDASGSKGDTHPDNDGSSDLSPEDMELMKRRLENLLGQ